MRELAVFFFTVTFLPRYRRRYRYYQHVRVVPAVLEQVVRISMPVSFQNILILLGFLIFVAITGIIGTTEQAASQVVISALFMSFLPCFGFGIGAQTLVGQSLGVRDLRLAQRYGVEAAKLATYMTIVLGLLFTLFPEAVIAVITDNAEVASAARPVLQVAGVTQVFYAAGIVLAHALQAGGRRSTSCLLRSSPTGLSSSPCRILWEWSGVAGWWERGLPCPPISCRTRDSSTPGIAGAPGSPSESERR